MAGCGAEIRGCTLFWDAAASGARQDALVLREVARWLLQERGMIDNDEAAVSLAKKINAYGVRRASLRVLEGRGSALKPRPGVASSLPGPSALPGRLAERQVP